MMRARRILARAVFAVGLSMLIAAAIAPLIPADRFGEPVGRALTDTLNRRVEIGGPVRFQLFGGPGISLGNVIIHDDPAVGIEPFAYVDSLEVGVRLSSLWKERLEFSHLRLVQPSVNLVKGPEGDWDYLPLLERVLRRSHSGAGSFPEIQVRAGRLNFKYDDTKSVFYFSNADVDAWPAEDEPDVVLVRFEGEPARTDQPAQGFGELSGGGRLILPSNEEAAVDLNLRLLRSAIPEVLTLLAGQGLGLEGFIASTARLRGPMSALDIEGELELAEFDRRYLLPGQPARPVLSYRGKLSLTEQELLLETAPGARAVSPISVRLRATQYLVQPKWAVGVVLRQLPLEVLLPLVGEMGFTLPKGVTAQGVITGGIGWSRQAGARGLLAMTDGVMSVDGTQVLHLGEMRLLLGEDGIELAPMVVELSSGETALVRSHYPSSGDDIDIALDTKSFPVDRLNHLWRRLTGSEPPPLLRSCRGGRVAGKLACRGIWSGDLRIEGAQVAVDGVAGGLEIGSAQIVLDESGFELTDIDARLGELTFTGRYRFLLGEKRPHWLDLSFGEVPAGEVERLLAPTLNPSGRGFIARTLRLSPPAPPVWMSERKASGLVKLAGVNAGPVHLTNLRWEFLWEGTSVTLRRIRASGDGATITGRVNVDLSAGGPAYDVQARVRRLPWQGGWLDAEGGLATSGTGFDVVARARAQGTFYLREIRAGSDVWDTLAGSFEMSVARGVPRLVFPCLELTQAGKTYYGMGQTTLTRSLDLELFDAGQRLHATGTLTPFSINLGPREQVR